MKPFFLSLSIVFLIPGYGQPEADLAKIISEYVAWMHFAKEVNNRDMTEAELDGMDAYYKRAEPYLDRVEKEGTVDIVKTAFYIRITMLRDMGLLYAGNKKDRQAYEYLGQAEAGISYFIDGTSFPIYIKDGSDEYVSTFNDYKLSLTGYYETLGEVCTRLSKLEEAKKWYYKLLYHFEATPWNKYFASSGLIYCKINLAQEDGELIDLYIKCAKALTGMDSMHLEQVRSKNYYNLNYCYAGMKNLFEKHPDYRVNGDLYNFANILRDGGEFSKASNFYKMAMDNGDRSLELLKAAYSAAIKANDRECLELAISGLDSLLALKEYHDSGKQYWLTGSELANSGFSEKAVSFFTRSIVAGYSDIEDMVTLLKNEKYLSNPELRTMIVNTFKRRIASGYNNINGLSAMMDGALLLNDRNMESDIINNLEKAFSKMKLAEQCEYASLMELRYGGWGYHEYAEKWLQKIIKCNKKHL